MKNPRTTRGVAFILLLLVLLPLLVFTAFEISRLNASVSVVAGIYGRQLDVVLFSINQFAWDVANTWASALEREWRPSGDGGTIPAPFMEAFFARNPAIDAVFVADSTGHAVPVFALRGGDRAKEKAGLTELLAGERPMVDRLLLLSRQNYRKIESLPLPGASQGGAGVVLLFVMRGPGGGVALAGIRLHGEKFVREVLGERMREAASGGYILSVVRNSGGEPVFETEGGAGGEPEQRRQLWLFPDLAAGISLTGETIEQVSHARVVRDLAMLLLLDAVLLTGIWVVYRGVRREMEFVRLKSDFVSNVSHDLRTPLALIRMYAETLEMGRIRGEEKKRRYYGTIVRETERLTRLVNNLLNFSRMEAGRKPYNLVPLDMNALVSGVLATFGPHFTGEGFTPVVVLDAGLPAVRADAEAVQEALINILDNAVKYSGPEKFLRVATGRGKDGVTVEIEDHGEGISREYREKIFETFFRIPASHTGGAKGSGLGLAIARHIMDAHGGRIDVRSEPGTGSTFTLTFRYDDTPDH